MDEPIEGEWSVSNSGRKVINLGLRIVIARDIRSQADAQLIASAPTLKQQRDDLLVACKAIKQRIHFIGLPSEPMNKTGPDWSKEIALLEPAITNCEA